jgi:hypothetical protein
MIWLIVGLIVVGFMAATVYATLIVGAESEARHKRARAYEQRRRDVDS